MGFPGGSDGKESAWNAGDPGLISGSLKIPWSRKWQLTPVFLPEEFHEQRSLAVCSPWGGKELDMTEWLSIHTHFKTGYKIINSLKLSAFKFCGILYELNEWLSSSPVPNAYFWEVLIILNSCHVITALLGTESNWKKEKLEKKLGFISSYNLGGTIHCSLKRN